MVSVFYCFICFLHLYKSIKLKVRISIYVALDFGYLLLKLAEILNPAARLSSSP